MSQVPAWFARKFDFAFPVEQYPNVCVRLRGTPARLEEMMRALPRGLPIAKPTGQEKEKWSAQEHAGHLLDLEPLWMARVEDFLSGGETLTVADLSNRKTEEAHHNDHEVKNISAQFREARLSLADRVEKFEPEMFARTMLHPRLKQPMRLVDHLYFVAEHDDHHLARIWEMAGRQGLGR
jgi:hypothetical protein